MKYTEAKLELSFIHFLEQEAYEYVDGRFIERESEQEVLIREDLEYFLMQNYPDLEHVGLHNIINEIAFQPASNLYEGNKYISIQKLLKKYKQVINQKHNLRIYFEYYQGVKHSNLNAFCHKYPVNL